jgi:hypothetical protein
MAKNVTLPPAVQALGSGKEPPEVMHAREARTVDAGWDTTQLEYLIDGEWVPAYRVIPA